MKISRKINGLYRSTKAIMVICAILLVITASSLLMLMLNPIQPKEPEVIVLNRHAPVQHTVLQTEMPETTEPEPVVQPVQTVHTLSTWSANVTGFKQNFAGFNQQELGITTPEPFPLRTTPKTQGKKVMEADLTPKTEISMVNESEARPTQQTVTQAIPVMSDDAV